MSKERISVVPSPALLVEYAHIHPSIPAIIIDAGQIELRREFWYAMVSLLFGGAISLSIIGGFLYLVMNGHPTAAASLLGTGALNMITGFIRNRIRK